ncbi:hypothetical protein G6F68_015023 [Rhizopus microsporus]|nr:hypothetical protein G6F68_015023 [Rhizopus microsporus]
MNRALESFFINTTQHNLSSPPWFIHRAHTDRKHRSVNQMAVDELKDKGKAFYIEGQGEIAQAKYSVGPLICAGKVNDILCEAGHVKHLIRDMCTL